MNFTLSREQVNYFHFLVATLLVYLGLYGTNSNPFILQSLQFIAVIGILYHIWRLYQIFSTQGFTINYWVIINLLHIFVIFPFLFNLGRNGGQMDPNIQKALPYVGAAVALYHGYRLYQSNQQSVTQQPVTL